METTVSPTMNGLRGSGRVLVEGYAHLPIDLSEMVKRAPSNSGSKHFRKDTFVEICISVRAVKI